MTKRKPAKAKGKGKKRRRKKITDKALRRNIEEVCRGKKSDKPAEPWISAPRISNED